MMPHFVARLVTHPGHYLLRLVFPTLVIGAVSFVVSWWYVDSVYYDVVVPPGLHSAIGVVIGLLLVFRTNTAYDRWWSGRKAFAELTAAHVGACMSGGGRTAARAEELLERVRAYLSTGAHATRAYEGVGALVQAMKEDGVPETIAQRHASDLLVAVSVFERIKSTPIPLSYGLHIKVSLALYLLSMPFGLFHDLGVWSAPMVMLSFYVIAGIEIISGEIEDPFHGDPNDLQVDTYLDEAREAARAALAASR